MSARDEAGPDEAELIAGRYRLVSELGSGAMGVVWMARDVRLGRTVAVKELRAGVGLSGTQVQRSHLRARREARIAARLHHPHAVAIYDVVEHEGRPYLVMEYVPSRSLAEVLVERTVLTPGEAAEFGAQLASALIAAHEAGIVHRDIKPANILLTEDGNAKLTDFGISRANDDVTLTGTGEMLGTPAYVAPEVAQGRTASAASDVFSLGATLYSAVEGVPPFGNGPTAMSLLLRIVNGEIRPPERIGPLTDTLMWMLRNNSADRPSMAAAQRALQAVAAASPSETIGTTPLPVPQPRAADAVPEATGFMARREAEAERDAAPASAAAVPAAPAATAPAATAPASTAPAPPADASERANASSRRRLLPWVILVVAAMAVAGIVAAIVATGSPGKSAATPPSTAVHTTSPAGSGSSSHAASSAPAVAAHSGTATTASSTGSSASASSSATASPAGDTTAQLTSAIAGYYKLVPDNLDQAWGYLTADYQQNHAGGPSGYREFWNQIQRVSASNIVALLPSTVTATIDYYYKNGQTVEERTSFSLVLSGGIWKIAGSSVLSSRSL